MSQMHFEESDLRAIQLFTSTFGVSFWNKTMFVLTFVNQAIHNCPMGIDESVWIKSKVDEWKKLFLAELSKHGVPDRGCKKKTSFHPSWLPQSKSLAATWHRQLVSQLLVCLCFANES